MAKTIVVADTSPLIAFGKVQLISLLTQTLGKIIIPEEVAYECMIDSKLPGAVEIQKAIHKNQIKIFENKKITMLPNLAEVLDSGEASAISLALQLKSNLLIDERMGREAAKKLNINIIGTAGVLLVAKKNKIIPKVRPILDELKSGGYYFSKDLMKKVLKIAKEDKPGLFFPGG